MAKVGNVAFLFVVVTLIVGAIIFTTVLSQTKSTSPTSDVRARAAAEKNLRLTGTVESTDTTSNTIVASGVQFEDSNSTNLGTWTVTAPTTYSVSELTVGSKILISADAKTFLAANKTMTATSISKR